MKRELAAGAKQTSTYARDTKVRANHFGFLLGKYTPLYGADEAHALATADAGPLDEGYVRAGVLELAVCAQCGTGSREGRGERARGGSHDGTALKVETCASGDRSLNGCRSCVLRISVRVCSTLYALTPILPRSLISDRSAPRARDSRHK
eukprot:scaffold52144_cov54-Phaeocystis_antarctica.AAC.2